MFIYKYFLIRLLLVIKYKLAIFLLYGIVTLSFVGNNLARSCCWSWGRSKCIQSWTGLSHFKDSWGFCLFMILQQLTMETSFFLCYFFAINLFYRFNLYFRSYYDVQLSRYFHKWLGNHRTCFIVQTMQSRLTWIWMHFTRLLTVEKWKNFLVTHMKQDG